MDGKITAGYSRYHEFRISADGQTISQQTDFDELKLPLLRFFVDAAGNYFYDTDRTTPINPDLALRPQGYVAKIDGFNPSKYYDDAAIKRLGAVPNTAMGAYVLPNLYAAGGNIEVNASAVGGSGNLTAQGGPLLKVSNASNRYLIANKMVMPDADSGGAVNFVGAAGKPVGFKAIEIDKGRLSAIDLYSSFKTDFGGQASDIIIQAGAANEKTILNPRGSFKLVNDSGNAEIGGLFDVLTSEIVVPKGTVSIGNDGYYSIGGAAKNVWNDVAARNRPSTTQGFIDCAAYSWYRNNLGFTSTNAAVYRNELGQLIERSADIYNTGDLFGELPNARNAPGANWFGNHYIVPFLTVPNIVLGSNEANQPTSATDSRLLANRVSIRAKYIDVNAPILAGATRDLNVTINNTKLYSEYLIGKKDKSFFECVLDARCSTANRLTVDTQSGFYLVPATSLTVAANSPPLNVYFDKVSRRVTTGNIGGLGVGAVTLDGIIMNSDNAGKSKIELASGASKVALNNQSGYELDLPMIQASNSGGTGVIRITDRGQLADVKGADGKTVAAPLTTWYVSSDGGANVAMYQDRLATDYATLTPITGNSPSNSASSSQYLPAKGLAYEWQNKLRGTRTHYSKNQSVNTRDWTVTDWQFGLAGPNWEFVPASDKVVYSKQGANFQTVFTTPAEFIKRDWVQKTYEPDKGPNSDKPWWVYTDVTLVQTNTVKADHAIAISFKGYTEGGVTINSNATTHLGNAIINTGGSTSVTVSKGNLIGHEGGLLAAKNIDLSVDLGAAKSKLTGDGASAALDVRMDAGGRLNAAVGGSLAINARESALPLGVVKAGVADVRVGGKLSLQALGDITPASANSVVSGYDVSLLSRTGRIGGSAVGQALALDLLGTTDGTATSAPTRITSIAILKAEAQGDVRLQLAGSVATDQKASGSPVRIGGDVRIDSIRSNSGDVVINAQGSLYDYKADQSGDRRDAGSRLTLWQDKLHLTDTSGKGDRTAAVADMLVHTIAPLDQQVNRDYQAFWALQALAGKGPVVTSNITLTASGLQTLRAQAAARFAKPQVSDTEVTRYANELLAGYGKTFDTLLGSGWQNRAAFTRRDSAYRFSADRYNEYWQLTNGSVNGQLTTAGKAQVRAMAATVLGLPPSDAQLQGYADQRLSQLRREFNAEIGKDWASQTVFKTYDPRYQVTADQTLLKVYASGSYWELGALENSIRSVALETGGGGNSDKFDHLNIAGRTVVVASTGVKAALGQADGALTLTLGSPLSDAMKLALSQASAPGDVQPVVDAKTGKITGLIVKNNRPIYLQADAAFSAKFSGQVAVQAQGLLQVNRVSSDGAVRLSAQNGITQSQLLYTGEILGASLVLDAGQGSLGGVLPNQTVRPLVLTTKELTLAKAGGSIYLEQPKGDLRFGVVTAGQTVSLGAYGGSILQKDAGLLSLVGQDVRLVAPSGDLGGAAQAALVMQINGGELVLDSNNAWLSTSSGTGGFKLGKSTLKKDATLTVTGSNTLTLVGASTVAGKATIAVGGAIASVAGSKLQVGATLGLSANAAAFNALQVTGNADLQISKALRIDDGQFGANLSGKAGSMSVGTLKVAGQMTLVVPVSAKPKPASTGRAQALATDGDGPSQAELALGSVQIDSLDVGGDADISAGGALALRGNVTVGGGLTASATESLSLKNVQVGQAMNLQAGTVLSAERVSAGGNAQMNSGGTLTLASLSAPGVKLDAVRDMQLDLLSATHAELNTATQIALREGRIADTISLRADKVQAGLVATDADGMVTELTGFQGQRASNVAVTMDTPSGWQMPVLNAVNAQLATNGSSTQIAVASIGASLSLSTPDGVVAMNKQATGLVSGAAVQLFTPTQDFALMREGKKLDTSATLVSQRADQSVAAPRLFTPVEGQVSSSALAVSGQGSGGQGLRDVAGNGASNGVLNGPLAALFPQLRRLPDGQWDFDALRRASPMARQTESVGELEF